jgi:hypothetical protein
LSFFLLFSVRGPSAIIFFLSIINGGRPLKSFSKNNFSNEREINGKSFLKRNKRWIPFCQIVGKGVMKFVMNNLNEDG